MLFYPFIWGIGLFGRISSEFSMETLFFLPGEFIFTGEDGSSSWILQVIDFLVSLIIENVFELFLEYVLWI